MAEVVTQACQKAFTEAGIKPEDVNYIEVFGSGVDQEDEAEVRGLTLAYQTPQPELSCAIGSVKANIGHTYAASGIASLIKTALCLYHRFIPATPQWSGPKKSEVWQDSPFYVAPASRSWWLKPTVSKRVAAINGIGLDKTYAHLILSEEPSDKERSNKYLEQMPFYLFPLAADDRSALLEQILTLQQTIEDCSSLSAVASQTFATFQKRSQANYALTILGHNKNELMQEIQRALKGVAYAFDGGNDWQTPLGSYFTAKPLGKKGTIAFVYPGLFNSYIGIGQNILHLFPRIYKLQYTYGIQHFGSLIKEELLYPRSLNSLSRRGLETLEQQLLNDPQAMLASGIVFAVLLTTIIRDYFQVQPQSVFGYSLGELSTICAQNVWVNYEQAINNLSASSLFGTRLSGSKNAVREYWGLPQEHNDTTGDFWSSYILMASASQVIEYLKHENRVYLTHINTPKEVVIAGDTQACLKMIQTLGCNGFPIPFDHVLHCEAMQSEYQEIAKLTTLPLQKAPEAVIYSAAEYKPMTMDCYSYKPIAIDSHSISHNIAKGLCQQLDFPRLINRVYEDGSRIFIEAGPGSTCSRWISETLKNKEHLTVPLNKRGVDDHTGIVKALAKLVSHRIALDLSPLYSPPERTLIPTESIFKKITLGGCRIRDKILSDESKKIIQDISFSKKESSKEGFQNHLKIQDFQELKKANDFQNERNILGEIDSYQSLSNENLKILETSQTPQEESNIENLEQVLSQKAETLNNIRHLEPLDSRNTRFNKLSADISWMTKSHTTFLQSRHESLKKISEIIKLQIACSQHLLNQK
jgi:PfaB family protein